MGRSYCTAQEVNGAHDRLGWSLVGATPSASGVLQSVSGYLVFNPFGSMQSLSLLTLHCVKLTFHIRFLRVLHEVLLLPRNKRNGSKTHPPSISLRCDAVILSFLNVVNLGMRKYLKHALQCAGETERGNRHYSPVLFSKNLGRC